ncbi:hypothetical protein THAOC_06643, partial [Thalassiosira oceanica]
RKDPRAPPLRLLEEKTRSRNGVNAVRQGCKIPERRQRRSPRMQGPGTALTPFAKDAMSRSGVNAARQGRKMIPERRQRRSPRIQNPGTASTPFAKDVAAQWRLQAVRK